jgi:predicted nucleic acid-binding Zn ribbon protein
MKKMKDKKCKGCGETFTPFQMGQKVCSPRCAIDFGRTQKTKEAAKLLRQQRRAFKENDRSYQLKKAQEMFNKYIRLRDKGQPCISCGRWHAGQIHAGHYRSVGAAPQLRFNEDNTSSQCMPCNAHKSGNAVEYRINLVKKIGVERVEALERDNEPKKYTLEEIKEIQKKYKAKCKELE